jgi:hypothetical protein
MKPSLPNTLDPISTVRLLVAGLIAASVTFPGVLQSGKAVVLAVALALAGLLVVQGRLAVSGQLYVGSLAIVLVGLAWSAYGLCAGNPGALRVMTVMVVYPAVLPFLAATYKPSDASRLYWLFAASGLLLVLLDLAFVAAGVLGGGDVLSALLRQLYDEWAVVDTQSDLTLFTLPNVASLAFLIPFFLGAALLEVGRRRRIIALVLTISGALLAVLAGRRALFVVTLAAPAVAMAITVRKAPGRGAVTKKRGARIGAAAALTVVCCAAVFFAEREAIDAVVDRATSIFDFAEETGNVERRLQFDALAHHIAANPLLGSGAGAAAEYVRSNEMPWSYELYYVSLVFQYGMVGFLAYAMATLWLVNAVRRRVLELGRASVEFYVLCGLIGFLLASATNPYLGKFDYMWVVFVPYAIVNGATLQLQQRSSAQAARA